MKNYNWKDIEKILKGYSPNKGGFKPILAYAPEFPVKLKSNFYEYLDFKEHLKHTHKKIEDEKYTFYSALSEKNKQYQITVQAYNKTRHEEIPILFESESFELNRRDDVNKYFRTPLDYFQMNGHIRVLAFKDTAMKEQEFKDIIELWRTQPPQTQS